MSRVNSNAALINNLAFQADPVAELAAIKRGNAAQYQARVNAFINWLQVNQPEAYELMRNMRRDLMNPGFPLSGLGDAASPGMQSSTDQFTTWMSDVSQFVNTALPAYFQYRTSKDLINLNLQRIAQGKDPISVDQVTPGINLGVSSDTRKLLYVAVGGLALVGILFALKKR